MVLWEFDELPASAARTDMVVKNITAIAASIVITVTNTAVVMRTVFLSTMISIFSVFFLICTPPYSLLSTYDIVNVTVSAYSPAAAFFQSSFLIAIVRGVSSPAFVYCADVNGRLPASSCAKI